MPELHFGCESTSNFFTSLMDSLALSPLSLSLCAHSLWKLRPHNFRVPVSHVHPYVSLNTPLP